MLLGLSLLSLEGRERSLKSCESSLLGMRYADGKVQVSLSS